MGRRSWGYALASALITSVLAGRASAQPPAEHAGEYAQADIQYGATVYGTQCTQCHGPTGDQVAGVDLRSGRFRNAASDDDLRRIVTQGIPGTSMPGRQLDPPEVTGIVAFIRTMRDFNAGTMQILLALLIGGAGAIFGIAKWIESASSGIPATSGAVMLAGLPVLVAIQLLLAALHFDIEDHIGGRARVRRWR